MSLQGSLSSLRSVSHVVHFTQYTIAHAHLGVYGFASFIAFGSTYFLLPRLIEREWPYPALIKWHFWLALSGFAVYFTSLTVGGVLPSLRSHDRRIGSYGGGARAGGVSPEPRPYLSLRRAAEGRGGQPVSGSGMASPQATREAREPIEGREPAPIFVWLTGFAVALFGFAYYGLFIGRFTADEGDSRTTQLVAASRKGPADGAAIFTRVCSSVHHRAENHESQGGRMLEGRETTPHREMMVDGDCDDREKPCRRS